MLLSQEQGLVLALSILVPLGDCGLFLVELGDDASELQDLVIQHVHLVFIFKQVVFVDVLNLKLVVFRPARLDTVTIIKHPQ